MDLQRDYYQCDVCKLVFVPPGQRLAPETELKRYQLHENDPDDPRYRKFLSRLFIPMNERIKPASKGLDFGSGPGPTLSVMFEEAGHAVRLFDIFFENDPSVFEEEYDFITSSETVEHLYNPLRELDRLWDCLKPGGWLGVMTGLVTDPQSFADWHYKNDDTHVIFFSVKTFEWLKHRWRAELTVTGKPGQEAVLFRKQ